MATRGQLLRSYVNQFGELLVANRKLQVEAGINRVQEQVAKGLVTPPSDEPLRDNRLYKEAWRDARSENMGREAGRLLMDDAPAMIAEAMEGYRYDQEGETPSERMTYLVDEWWSKHKQNVGFDDLSFNPKYTQQWEAAKTRAYGALRDVVQTETTKQALNEARGVIQTRLGAFVSNIGPGDFDAQTYDSQSYKNIRDELVGMNYPLIRSQIEGLLHDEVISSNMNTLNDPASTQDEWMQALEAIEALDEQGFGDNGMSLSEIVTGKKSPESEASTRALAQFLSRMEKQKTLSTKQNDSTLDENWRRLSAMSDKEFAKQGRAYIAYNVPKERVNAMLTRFERVTKENPNFDEGLKALGNWKYKKMFGYPTEQLLFNALLLDPVLSKPEHEERRKAVLAAWRDNKKDEDKIAKDQKTLNLQQSGISSFKGADLISGQFDENLAKARKKYKLDETDVAYLKAKSARLKTLRTQMTDEATFQNFINLIDRDDLYQMRNSDFQKAIKDFPPEYKAEVREIRKEQFSQKATDRERELKLGREQRAQERFAVLSEPTPEKIQKLIDMDLEKLPMNDILKSEEGLPLYNELIDLKRSYIQTRNNATAQAVENRKNRRIQELTQESDISKILLTKINLDDEAGVQWARINNMSFDELEMLRRRQTEVLAELGEEGRLEIEQDTSLQELFRILELPDKEILEVTVSTNKKLTKEEHGKKILDLQRQIRERNKTIEQSAEKERRSYWVKEFTDPNQTAFLLGIPDSTLVKLLGEQTPEYQDVIRAKRQAQENLLLPENQKAYNRTMYRLLGEEDLTTYTQEEIESFFPIDVEGNEGRLDRVMSLRLEQVSEKRSEKKAEQKAREALAPENMRMDLEKAFSEIITNSPNLKKAELLKQLKAHSAKVDSNSENLTQTHFTPLNNAVTDLIDQIQSEPDNYTDNWRPIVTQLFNENIKYPFDEYSFLATGADNKEFTTRLRVQRQKAVDMRELHKHMIEKFDDETSESWDRSDVERYLIPYLTKLDEAVQKNIQTITGLEQTGENPQPLLPFSNLSQEQQATIQEAELPNDWLDMSIYLFQQQYANPPQFVTPPEGPR